jgi:excisionase family DNA binding protein
MNETPYQDKDVVDIKETAEILDVSTKTVRRYIQTGKLAATKVRNVWFFNREDVTRLKEEEEPSLVGAKEILDFLKVMSDRIESLELAVGEFAEGREQSALQALREDLGREVERLTEENQQLRDVYENTRAELDQLRSNIPKDMQTLKSKMEEIASLKSTIASNERGLALLREELQLKEKQLRDKDLELVQLRERAGEAEKPGVAAEQPETRRGGLFAAFNRTRD